MAWLILIAGNLVSSGMFYDLAVCRVKDGVNN